MKMETDILDKFIEKARENVNSGYYKIQNTPIAARKSISLKEKLTKNNFSLIAEIKHASPAGEYYFENIDAEQTAIVFKDAGADAISVVVEPQIFKGKLENIISAKKSGLPVLFKDFIIDERQIKAAAELGADCILLVQKVINRIGLNAEELIKTAHSFGLEVLLECYDKNEMQGAVKTNADILGINNRDLRTLKVNLNRTKEILEFFNGSADRPVISESGVRVREDAEFLKSAGVSGILVGTAIWTSENQADKIRELKLGRLVQ